MFLGWGHFYFQSVIKYNKNKLMENKMKQFKNASGNFLFLHSTDTTLPFGLDVMLISNFQKGFKCLLSISVHISLWAESSQ